MNTIKLEVKTRDVGKRAIHALRKTKMVPAIVYGAIPNHPIALSEKLLLKYSHKKFENTIFYLQCDQNTQVHDTPVLIKTIERDPVTQKPLHLDFYAPDMNKKVSVHVDLEFVGKSIGEAEGGVLEIMQRELELLCLPGQIPKHIQVHVNHLKKGDVYHISHLKLPEGVTAVTSVDLPLCAVKEARKVIVETPTEKKDASTDGKDTSKKEDQQKQKETSSPKQKETPSKSKAKK